MEFIFFFPNFLLTSLYLAQKSGTFLCTI